MKKKKVNENSLHAKRQLFFFGIHDEKMGISDILEKIRNLSIVL